MSVPPQLFTTSMGDSQGVDNLNAYFGNLMASGRMKNYLINGNFDVWQRGTSFTLSEYNADRWKYDIGTGGSVTVSRQAHTVGQTDVPNNPKYFLRIQHTVLSSSQPRLSQSIEGVHTLAGKNVTLSFYAKCSGPMIVNTRFVQIFGSGGSTSAVVTPVNITTSTSFAKYTCSFTLPSISGKTVGAGSDDCLRLDFLFPTGTTYTLDLSSIQVEEGTIATEFEYRPLQYELLLCRRYYERTGNSSFINAVYGNTYSANNYIYTDQRYMNEKRVVPTVGIYSTENTPTVNSVSAIGTQVATALGTVTIEGGTKGFVRIGFTNAIAINSVWWYNFVADAEF